MPSDKEISTPSTVEMATEVIQVNKELIRVLYQTIYEQLQGGYASHAEALLRRVAASDLGISIGRALLAHALFRYSEHHSKSADPAKLTKFDFRLLQNLAETIDFIRTKWPGKTTTNAAPSALE